MWGKHRWGLSIPKISPPLCGFHTESQKKGKLARVNEINAKHKGIPTPIRNDCPSLANHDWFEFGSKLNNITHFVTERNSLAKNSLSMMQDGGN